MIQTGSVKVQIWAAYAFLIIFLAIVMFPLAAVTSISFRTGNFAIGSFIPENPTLEHWYLALEQDYLGSFQKRSIFGSDDDVLFHNGMGRVTINQKGHWTLEEASRISSDYLPIRSHFGLASIQSGAIDQQYIQIVEFHLEIPEVQEIGVVYLTPGSLIEGRLVLGDLTGGQLAAVYQENYLRIHEHPVLTWLWNSVKVAGVTSFLILLLSTTSAYAFSRMKLAAKNGILKSMLMIQMFPNTLFLVALYALFIKMGNYVSWLGVDSHAALVIGYLGTIALHIWLIIGYFNTIDSAMEESAAIDGATPWQTFYRILLPMSLPILSVVFILAFIGLVNEYPLASVLITDLDKLTLAVGSTMYMYEQNLQWGDFAAAAILSGFPITIVFLISQKFLVGGLTAGGVKG